MKYQNFVAVDFETMDELRTSACSIGMVKVKGGEMVDTFYSLIKPIPDGKLPSNIAIHNITMDMVKGAPTFEELFPRIIEFVEGLVLVCHNKSMDQAVIKQCMQYYHLSGLDWDNMIDTYGLFHSKLETCCEQHGIDQGNKHDALADAKACACLLLCYEGEDYFELRKEAKKKRQNERYKRSEKYPILPDESIKNKDTPFFRKEIVVTGLFKERFYDRKELEDLLYITYGGRKKDSVSKKTDIIIVGDITGTGKLSQLEKVKAGGSLIRVIYKDEFYKILDKLQK